jgi:O-antigen/teichoic acid export membrane protein
LIAADRYGSTVIGRSIGHFLIGKVVSSTAGFFYLMLIVRRLNIEEFAAYAVLEAFIEMFTALTGFGLTHTVLRYIPELYGQHYYLAFTRLISLTLTLRTATLLALALVTFYFSDQVSEAVGLSHVQTAFKAFLLIVLVRVTTFFISQILEAMLSQGISQGAFTAISVSRLAMLGWLILHHSTINLLNVIWIELAADGLGLLIMLIGLIMVLLKKPSAIITPIDDAHWLKINFRRVLRYGIAGYLQHLAILPYGSSTNRLLVGHYLGSSAIASFGFAQSMYEYLKRYLPAQLLLGVVRPVLIARFAQNQSFKELADAANLVLKINLYFIGVAIVLLPIAGVESITLLTGGKYGLNALHLLEALLIVLVLETARQQLDTLTQITEHNAILIKSNLLLSVFILPGAFLLPTIGALALPIANAVGLIVSMCLTIKYLALQGYIYRHDWLGFIKIVTLMGLALSVGISIKYLGGNWIIASISASIIYLLACMIFGKGDLRQAVSFIRNEDKPKMEEVASTWKPRHSKPKRKIKRRRWR